MERDNASKDQGEEIPHAPPFIQPAVESVKEKNVSPPIQKLKRRVRMARSGVARKGKSTRLSTNHFKASIQNINEHFFQYSVNLKYEDDQPVVGKVISRKVIDKMQQIYNAELGGKELVFDADKTLFTIGPLLEINNEFTVIIDNIQTTKSSGNESPGENDGDPDERDNNGARQTYQAKIIKVDLRFAAKIPMQSIDLALNGEETENTLRALRVLDIILSPHAAKQFIFRPGGGDNAKEITMYDHHVKYRGTPLSYSEELPCIIVGKPKRPSYFSIELCKLVPLQRYKKATTVQQRASLVEKSRQKPDDRMLSIINALKNSKHVSSSTLQSCGVFIDNYVIEVEGRVLQPPKLEVVKSLYQETAAGILLTREKELWNLWSLEEDVSPGIRT